MIGGAGNDTYYVDSSSDVTTETSATHGFDQVYSWVSRTLGNYQEKLVLAGNAAINGYGNAKNNLIYGNLHNNALSGYGGDDHLSGSLGNDSLNGGFGNDTMVGGDGADRFYFTSALNPLNNVDTITDFEYWHDGDRIVLDTSIFTKFDTGTPSYLNLRQNISGTAEDSDDYLVYNTTTGALSYDSDGSGSGVAVQFASLSNVPSAIGFDAFTFIA